MDQYLIKSVQIISPGSPHHDQVADVMVSGGSIQGIAKRIEMPKDGTTHVVDGKGKYLCPGFFDLNVNFGEPGYETKEDVRSGAAAAFAGGFTGVAIQPNTDPPLHRHAEIALIRKRAEGLPVDIHPVGTISKRREGTELAEMYDMKLAGAVAFSDGDRSVADAGLMARALLYAKGIGTLVISFPDDRNVSDGAKMNEGKMSTYLGMKGNPNLAEALMVARDLYLAEYHDARIHFTSISTAESVDLIRKAKSRGLKVTCDVAAHHLVLTDEAIAGFDSHYKVHPPLRTGKDIKALRKGLKDGVIDAIISQHTPHEVEFKRVEFHHAKDGMIGLQTALPLLLQAGLTPRQIVDKLAVAPRHILRLPVPVLEEGVLANFTVFDPETVWKFDAETNRSKSKNSPFLGDSLRGAVILAINNHQSFIHL